MAKTLIDWTDEKSHILINPLQPEAIRNRLHEAVSPYTDLKEHLWLASSGTENFPKMVALSKKAMLISAEAVNEHLQVVKKQRWLNILPLFHVGGLGIHARAFLSGSLVYDFSGDKWSPENYVRNLCELNIAYSSLTPTHVYDIVLRNLSAPKKLIAIIVGGGVLSRELHEKAFALGWPLLISYGMTEVCSQIATTDDFHSTAALKPLQHVNLRFNEDEGIEIKSEALFTGFVHGNDPKKQWIDPKVEGWYTTQDRGELFDNTIQVYGRGANFMKIGGENISFSELEAVWESIRTLYCCSEDVVLIDLPDERLGRVICLVAIRESKKKHDFTALVKEYHQRVIPIAKIRRVYYLDAIPRTELYKLKKTELRQMISRLYT